MCVFACVTCFSVSFPLKSGDVLFHTNQCFILCTACLQQACRWGFNFVFFKWSAPQLHVLGLQLQAKSNNHRIHLQQSRHPRWMSGNDSSAGGEKDLPVDWGDHWPRVHVGRGLIDDEDAVLPEDSPGQAHQLPLAHAEVGAWFSEHRLQLIGQVLHHGLQLHLRRGRGEPLPFITPA